jgi:hypothetical protein
VRSGRAVHTAHVAHIVRSVQAVQEGEIEVGLIWRPLVCVVPAARSPTPPRRPSKSGPDGGKSAKNSRRRGRRPSLSHKVGSVLGERAAQAMAAEPACPGALWTIC